MAGTEKYSRHFSVTVILFFLCLTGGYFGNKHIRLRTALYRQGNKGYKKKPGDLCFGTDNRIPAVKQKVSSRSIIARPVPNRKYNTTYQRTQKVMLWLGMGWNRIKRSRQQFSMMQERHELCSRRV